MSWPSPIRALTWLRSTTTAAAAAAWKSFARIDSEPGFWKSNLYVFPFLFQYHLVFSQAPNDPSTYLTPVTGIEVSAALPSSSKSPVELVPTPATAPTPVTYEGNT